MQRLPLPCFVPFMERFERSFVPFKSLLRQALQVIGHRLDIKLCSTSQLCTHRDGHDQQSRTELCALDGLHQVLDVNLDVYKDVQASDGGHVHRHQAGVAIVHQQICLQGARTEVINAASAVGHITQDEHMLCARKAARRRNSHCLWPGRSSHFP